MWYTIGDLAEILGITTSAVRFLESENIIHPQKDAGGRRQYDIEDVFRLLSYTKYKSMKIPLKEISRHFYGDGNDRGVIRGRLETARQNALDKAAHYARLAASIGEYLEHIEAIDTLLNRYTFAQSSQWLFLADEHGGLISKDRQMRQTIRRWVETMPQVQLAAVLEHQSGAARLGYLISAAQAEGLGLAPGDGVWTMPPTSCLHTIRTLDAKFVQTPQVLFDEPLRYAVQRGLHITGDPVGRIILVETERYGALDTYVDIWIPIA